MERVENRAFLPLISMIVDQILLIELFDKLMSIFENYINQYLRIFLLYHKKK